MSRQKTHLRTRKAACTQHRRAYKLRVRCINWASARFSLQSWFLPPQTCKVGAAGGGFYEHVHTTLYPPPPSNRTKLIWMTAIKRIVGVRFRKRQRVIFLVSIISFAGGFRPWVFVDVWAHTRSLAQESSRWDEEGEFLQTKHSTKNPTDSSQLFVIKTSDVRLSLQLAQSKWSNEKTLDRQTTVASADESCKGWTQLKSVFNLPNDLTTNGTRNAT